MAVTGYRPQNDNGTMATMQIKLVNVTTGEHSDYILVPRRPTEAMIKAGWYEAHDENPLGVWHDMIEAWESSIKDGEFSNGQRLISPLSEL